MYTSIPVLIFVFFYLTVKNKYFTRFLMKFLAIIIITILHQTLQEINEHKNIIPNINTVKVTKKYLFYF